MVHLNISPRLVVQVTAVLIVVAIYAKVLPVAAVGRVVVVVMIFVVHGQKMKIF
jgi:uncharacterized membrane protein